METLERYLHSVGRWLPRRQRKDIIEKREYISSVIKSLREDV